MGTQHEKHRMGKVEIRGSQRQKAETAVALHRAGKDVRIVSRDDTTYLVDYHDYTVLHHDTRSIIATDSVYHATLEGNSIVIAEGEEMNPDDEF